MIEQKELTWQILLPGIPITADRGALGWSTVTLVRGAGYNLLVDTGSYGDRGILLSRLGEAGLKPEEIDAVFLTHFHYDHMLNFDLFTNALFYLAEEEIDYICGGGYQRAKDPYVVAVCYPLFEEQVKPF
ncbi:MAG: MBL fold metallo-hydrolase, partial [Desulforhopalus sp.]